eukprot:7332302-Ditylum_brightwellii.AAC.1
MKIVLQEQIDTGERQMKETIPINLSKYPALQGLQGIAKHPSVMVTYITFLVANLELGKAEMLNREVAKLRAEVK